MKCLLVYFSITGNTKKIAYAIHKGMTQAAEQCDIVRLKDMHGKDFKDYDLIGLGSPVMWQKEFPNVTDFIEYGMRSVDGKHGFVFCTHGAMPGHYLSRVVPAMIQKGLTVVGWNNWFGAAYFPCIPKPYYTDGHPDAIDLKEAEDFGREMVERSRRISQGETQLIPEFPKGKEYDEIYDPFFSNLDEGMRKEIERKLSVATTVQFRINTEKCRYPKCSFCMDNCPMDAIDLSATPPLFNRDCALCWSCEMACPQGAIEYDFEQLHAVHEDSGLQKSLEVLEAKGRFRRLVPLENIGWDTPFWKFEKPRYKISR